MFEAVAAQYPQRTAVTAEDGSLTYRQLHEKSDRLAGELLDSGVKSGTVVGLYTHRGTDLLTGLLGILKAGAAYLPLDPGYPAQRVRWALSDAQCAVVVASADLRAALGGLNVRTVATDRERPPGGPRPDLPQVRATDPAYVIHTSGSTGEPKGVQIEHHSVVRLFTATRPWFGFTEHDVWTLFHSAAFDFSVWEIWGALLYGGRLVVVPAQTARSPAAFHRLLRDEGVTVLSQTPGAFRRLAAADAGAAPLSALRTVVLGGESLDPAGLRPWLERYGDEGPRVVNMYGITEATVHASYRPILRADLDRRGPSPIGVPLPGLTFHLRDATGRAVPDGTPGELHIEGPSLARGYLGRPALTAERFAEGPPRTYRTGDRVVRLADGEYGYLGRVDDQIKLRGYRIEPGEIETLLTRHPAVDAAVVRPHNYGEDDVRLVAYVTCATDHRDGPAALVAELRELAADALPPHMRPSACVVLAALPLTANGKVDRATLPAPGPIPTDGPGGTADDGPAGPEGSTAARIFGIWRAVLDVEHVTPDADFFDLGGTSLSLLRMFERVNAEFGTDLDVTVLIDGATVGSLSSHVDAVRKPEGDV
ncbi:amino acid adenylation domain-containing protein [Streptomyces pinistramenti]|uniref:amino acid adenylation domain-containing protein n=1 Tax=Streptomyces pinistramenti TaxID=2884812 RepID=UPI001D08DB50|nr:amino acid adenylation domain-containing protein [Streptomyces pinistramenti]MCB5907502.1 amino acid adenylation domain-containing protein [Streptomyces pinistramenti]